MIKLWLKNNKFPIFVLVLYLILFFVAPQRVLSGLSNSAYYLKEMALVMPVIFMLTVAIESLVPKEVILKHFGKGSGFLGNVYALVLGSLSAGPIYAAFPIGKMLISKGASVSNLVIVLSAWAVIKVPMLANEVKFLGINFMLLRWILTVAAIFFMAWMIQALVKRNEIVSDKDTSQGKISLEKECCIGCGICQQLEPRHFKMVHKKAEVISDTLDEASITSLELVIEKCPVHAIKI